MNKSIVLIAALVFTVACASKPKSEPAPQAKQATEVKKDAQVTMSEEYKRSLKNVGLSCTRDSDVRKVEIEAQKPKGCDLYYTTSGNRNKIAWSTNGDSHCSNVKSRIQTNLEQAGYKCEEPARASASEVKTEKK